MTTETTKPDLVTEVESLLNDVGFRGDFETVSRPLLRRLVAQNKRLRQTLTALKTCQIQKCSHCASLLRATLKDHHD